VARARWDKGQLLIMQNELWLKSSTGVRRGLYGQTYLPEVMVLTWALAQEGAPIPDDFDSAMTASSYSLCLLCCATAM